MILSVILMLYFYPISPDALFLNPLKKLEDLEFFDVFRGYRNGLRAKMS